MSDVPIAELEALAGEFKANATVDAGMDNHDAADRWDQAADELTKLIEEYDNE